MDEWSGKYPTPLPLGCAPSDCVDGPWRSLDKISNFSFKPGDSILLNRGRVWTEGLSIQTSGEPGSPILFGAYGEGDLPLIRPAPAIDSWTKDSPTVWKAPTGTPPSNRVWVDDLSQEWAREPDEGYYSIQSTGPLDTQFVDANLHLPLEEVLGATIRLHLVPWILETRVVIGYSTTTHRITLNKAPTYTPLKASGGYALMGKRSYLDQPGEWAWEHEELFLWPSDNQSPVNRSVRMSATVNGISIDDQHDITVQEWAMEGADPFGVFIQRSTGIVLSALNIQKTGQIGILARPVNGFIVKECAITDSGRGGIEYDFSSNVQILNNTIEDSGLHDLSTSGGSLYSAQSKHVVISGNHIRNSVYSGLHVHGDDTLIKNNRIENSCLSLGDCGGIYTHGKNQPDREGEIQIIGNLVKGALSPMSNGIYIDDNSNHVRVENNTVQDVEAYGIYFHNTRDSIAAQNTVFGSKDRAFIIIEDHIGEYEGYTRGNRIEGNLLFPSPTATAIAGVQTEYEWTFFGDYDHNVFGTVFSPYSVRRHSNSESASFTLSDWIIKSGEDQHSTVTSSFYEFVPYREEGSQPAGQWTFDSDISSWSKYTNPPGGTLTWASAAECEHDGGCLAATYDSLPNHPMTISTKIPLVAGTGYRVQLDIRSNKPGPLWLVVRQKVGVPSLRFMFDMSPGHWQTLSQHFVATETVDETEGRFWIETRGTTSDYQVDNVTIRTVTPNDPKNAVHLVVNEESFSQSFPLTGAYVDAWNNPVAGSVDLAPYSSLVLLPAFNNGDGTCNNRETHATAPEDCPTPGGDDRTPPAVFLSSPTQNAVFTSLQPVLIEAAARDDVVVAKVQFLLDGVVVDTDTAHPYKTSWPISSALNGTHTWSAIAFDLAGNRAESDPVPVTVAIDDSLPSIAITDPLPGTTFATPQILTIQTHTTKSVDIQKVWFIHNGVVVTTTTHASAYTFSWPITRADNGAHTWTATAFDAHGNRFTGPLVSVTVDLPSETLETARAYPSPFRPGLGAAGITFDQLPPQTTVRIYAMDGRPLKAILTDSSGRATWDITNNNGRSVASGVYRAITEKNGERKVLKVLVQR